MRTDTVEQVVGKLGRSFSLQLDESTDVSGNAQLIAFVRYTDTDNICEQVLFCKGSEGKTTREKFVMLLMRSSVKTVSTGNPAPVSVLTQLHQ